MEKSPLERLVRARHVLFTQKLFLKKNYFMNLCESHVVNTRNVAEID